MIEVGTKVLNFCILHSCVMRAARMTYGITPQEGIYILQNGLTVSLDIVRAHMYEYTGSIPVQST